MLYLKAYAKINLFLNISSKLKNNYHSYESLIVFLDLFDEIFVEKTNDFKIEIKGEFGDDLKGDIFNNLLYKVIVYFEEKYEKKFNYSVSLIKNIPVASGMGGGSADCAKMILIINHLWNLNLSIKDMMLIAESFGTDVSACLLDKLIFVEGIGNKIHILNNELIDFKHVLIVNPLIQLSTKSVFDNFTDSFKNVVDYRVISKIDSAKEMFDLITVNQNSLLNAATNICPQILKIIFYLENTNASLVRMSGSGATCFGVYSSKKELDSAYASIKEVLPNYYIKKTQILNGGN